MDLGVELAGGPDLDHRLARAHDGILHLDRELTRELHELTPPQVVFASTRMRERAWGAGDVWRLPAGGWVSGRDGRVHLPDDLDQLVDQVQNILNGE